MPTIEYFPYMGPNRRSDLTMIEIRLGFTVQEQQEVPLDRTRALLIDGGVISASEPFPEQALPDHWMTAYASLLAQTALLLQRKTGHRVNAHHAELIAREDSCLALVEHEHCDVGMTAVKLAFELVSDRRRALAEPFRMFSKFARERLLPYQTEAIISAARSRDIPAIHLERQPYRREDFDDLTGGECHCPNGLLMLGHGKHKTVIDGTWGLDLQQDLSPDTADPDEVAEQIVERLFPGQQSARMPIIAITGTNGKTTTTRMINHIMQRAGRKPGMVCTDGIFLDGRKVDDADRSARPGHLRVLTDESVDIAVLETHHAGILSQGFAFRWCDIAVCLNVSDDHLGDANVKTVEEMAKVKQALPERARHAAVLNADNEHSLAMIDAMTADKVCLVSVERSASELQTLAGDSLACCCVLENDNGQDWLVIHDAARTLPVVAAAKIPATFDGAARFMTANAMHAVIASYLAGIDVEVIRASMESFESSYEATPGRLNVFDGLPFKVLLDFAHNPDGMRKLCEFIDGLQVDGRKLIAFAGTASRRDETIREFGRSAAGHFDFYICKEHIPSKTLKKRRAVAHLVQEGLSQAGVARNQTMITSNGQDVMFEIFDLCEPGDLLVVVMGHVEKHLLGAYLDEYARQKSGSLAS